LVVSDDELENGKQDIIAVKTLDVCCIKSSPYYRSRFLSVQGCTLEQANGRFIESGLHCHAPKFQNVRNWVIFRCSVKEIPELGIFASNCYDSLKDESILVTLDKSAGI
jgi:hypothetical protein